MRIGKSDTLKTISATTFQLHVLFGNSFTFKVGTRVVTPFGTGEIIKLDDETGKCTVKLKTYNCPDCGRFLTKEGRCVKVSHSSEGNEHG